MEHEVIVERKTVPDLVKSIIQERKSFIEKCERLERLGLCNLFLLGTYFP